MRHADPLLLLLLLSSCCGLGLGHAAPASSDRPLIELLIDMLLSDAGFSGGNTTREDLLEDLTLKLVDLADTPASARLAGTEALALPIATTLLDETWIGATPGKKPSVQVRELSEAKAAVERWQPRFSAGEWSADRSSHVAMRGEVMDVDERDNSCKIRFYSDGSVVWFPATALITTWDERQGHAIRLDDENADLTDMMDRLMHDRTNLEQLLEAETAHELTAMQRAETKSFEEELQKNVQEVHEAKLAEQIKKLERHGFSRNTLTTMATNVPSQIKPELIRVGVLPSDAQKLMDMVVPKSKRKTGSNSVMDGVYAWLNRENVGPALAPDEVMAVPDVAEPKEASPQARLSRARAVRNFTMSCDGLDVNVTEGQILVVLTYEEGSRWWTGYLEGGNEVPGQFLSNAVDLLSIGTQSPRADAQASGTGSGTDLTSLGLLGAADVVEDSAPPQVKIESMLTRFRSALKLMPALSAEEAEDLETKFRLELDDRALHFAKKRDDLHASQEQRRLRNAASLAKIMAELEESDKTPHMPQTGTTSSSPLQAV